MVYITERIVNLKDFERVLGLLSLSIQTGDLEKSLELIKQLEDFEFEIEKRKVSYCE
nr:MAG TPA: hypothetical protein [Caudoviricetes sp.]